MENWWKLIEGIHGLAEAIPQLVWASNAYGHINYINQRYVEYVGGSSAQEVLSHWYDALHPADKEQASQAWFNCILTGEIFQREFRLKRFDGTYHWFLGRAVPIKNQENHVERWIGTATDIEDQKRLLGDLQRSRDQLRIIIEGITDGVTVFDRNGNFIFANQIGARMCGFDSVEEMISTPTEQVMSRYVLLDEEGNPFPLEKLPGRLALKGNRNPPETIIQFFMKGSGERRWSIVNAAPVFDDNGDVLYAVSIFRDFTTHKENENALKGREATFRLIAEAGVILNSSLNYLVTLQQLCELIVPQMADWCVVDILRVTEKPTKIVWHRDPAVREWAKEYQKKYPQDWNAPTGAPKVVRTGQSEFYEHIPEAAIERAARSPEHLADIKKLGMNSVMIVPIVGSQGVLGAISLIASESGRIFTNLDLTLAEDIGRRAGLAIEKALLYESEKTARELAENANHAKTTFLANMSHEIRTPLNALIGFNEILRSENLTEEERAEYHNIIQRNGDLLLHLIDDILDLSKVEGGHIDWEIMSVSLPELLNEVTALMKAKADAKGLQLMVEFIGDIPQQLVTDPLRLKQILNNVIGNAIKFTTQGYIKISVQKDQTKERLIFSVTDTGIGISEKVREKLFKPFSQADASVTRKYGGTGLGLILSKKLAQGLGGDLVLQNSQEGMGTTFCLEIATNLVAKTTPPPPVARPLPSLKGRKILVIDDSLDNQLLIEHLLTKMGAVVDCAENGDIGVKKALKENYDLILMDVQMPVLDGHSATRILREKNFTHPIIALTAHAMNDDRQKCDEAGCTDYLTKPVNVSALIQTITKHLP